MQIALFITFRANRKEPLAVLLERIHAAFLASSLDPAVQFSLSDAPLPGFTSSVDRVLKRHPNLRRFLSDSATMPGGPTVRQLGNRAGSPAASEAIEFATLLEIAAGVPRSFPFHNASVHFQSPEFGAAVPLGLLTAAATPGVIVGDSWWVNGRVRSVSAMTTVDADPASKKLPSPPQPVSTVLAACGKVTDTVQLPLAGSAAPAAGPQIATPPPEIASAVSAILLDYRARLAEVIDRAVLPHDLPPALEALRTVGLGETTGPKKPVLVRAFKPMGYDCRGGSGTFTLRRQTPGNLTVQLDLDVGTWSRSLTAFFRVSGLGFSVVLPLPVSKRAMDARQYQIGGAENWQRIVDNLAALVAEFDKSFVPAVEAAAGPSPAWYKPES